MFDVEDAEDAADTPPPLPPAKRTASRIRMDPEYAAALRRLCEAPAPAAIGAEGGAPRAVASRAAERLKWGEQYRMLAQRELLVARTVLNPAAIEDRGLAADLAPVVELVADLAADRAAERAYTDKRAAALRDNVQRVRELMVRGLAGGDGRNALGALQECMEAVEDELSRRRAQHAHTTAALARIEAELSAELAEHESDFEVWPGLAPAGRGLQRSASAGVRAASALGVSTRPATAGGRARAGAGATDANDDAAHAKLSEAIATIDAQLEQLGGATCGWPEEEAALFARVRAQAGNPPLESNRLLSLAGAKLPELSFAELRAHAGRLAQREALLKSKRAAVAAWRAARATTDARRAERERELEERMTAQELETRRLATAARARAREARDAELGRWKEAKSAEIAVAQAEASAAAADLVRRREREARHSARQRDELAAHAKTRKAEKSVLLGLEGKSAAADAAASKAANAAALQRLRERDAKLVEAALERRRAREKAEVAKRERTEWLMQRVCARACVLGSCVAC
jgi:hypothetical protein